MRPKDITRNIQKPLTNHAVPYKKFGNIGTGKNSSLGIRKRKPKAIVFASRYDPSVDIKAVSKDLENNLLTHTGEKHNVVIEQIETRFNTYSSFKITCECENTDVFMNSDIWPAGIVFKWWRSPQRFYN